MKDNSKDDGKATPIPPPVPPPTPPSDRKASSLLSPWWSAEPNHPPRLAEAAEHKPSDKDPGMLIKFTRIGRVYDDAKEPLFKERCYLITRKNTSGRPSSLGVVPVVDPTAECRMVCFLRENEQRRQERRSQASGYLWNPFIGMWVIVAKTRQRCLEHSNENDIYKKSSEDYYTIDLADQWSRSGDNLRRMVVKTFVPMQELGRQYLESWNNGAQTTFLNRMWERAKTGEGLTMAYKSIRNIFLPTDKNQNNGSKGAGK